MNARLGWIDIGSYAAYVALLAVAAVSGQRGVPWAPAVVASLACAVLWFVARLQLGASFSVGAEARRLVTHGLYARFRHPIYIFGTMAFLWAVLALMGAQALVVWMVVGVVQFARIRREERVLAEAFGDEYAAWRATTWL